MKQENINKEIIMMELIVIELTGNGRACVPEGLRLTEQSVFKEVTHSVQRKKIKATATH